MFSVIGQAFDVTWLVVRLAVFVGLPVAVITRLSIGVYRFARLPRGSRRYQLAATWHRLTWRRLARRLDLARPDPHRGGIAIPATSTATIRDRRPRLLYPRARFTAHPYGIKVSVRPVPGCGRADLEKQAEHLASAYGAWRLSITQPKPRKLELFAYRRDPLCEPYPVTDLPRFDGRHLHLGRDEFSAHRRFSVANHSGIAFSGMPGRGKTEAALSLIWQLSGSPAVEIHCLDGGELDWQPFADGFASYVTDPVEAVDRLDDLVAGMNLRRRTMPDQLGVRNMWAIGPSEPWPLRVVLIEECPVFLDETGLKGDRLAKVREAKMLVGSLIRRGRAPGYLTILMTQKATTTGGMPPDLRDLCGLRWSFGVATTEAAVAILGDSAREFPTLSPVTLQGDEHVGVASTLLRTGLNPLTLLRFPAVGEERADAVAAELAARKAITA